VSAPGRVTWRIVVIIGGFGIQSGFKRFLFVGIYTFVFIGIGFILRVLATLLRGQ